MGNSTIKHRSIMIYNYYKLSHLQGDDLLAEAMAYDNHSLPKQLKQILPDFE